MNFLTTLLADGFFAAVAAIGFAIISNPSKKVLFMSGLLAAMGHMARFVLIQQGMGIANASLCAALFISLCSILCALHWRTPAEIYVFPALLPMIPGMFAYKAILSTMQFLRATDGELQQEFLVDIVYNGMKALFIMCALVIGAILPIQAFHHESFLMKGFKSIREHSDSNFLMRSVHKL